MKLIHKFINFLRSIFVTEENLTFGINMDYEEAPEAIDCTEDAVNCELDCEPMENAQEDEARQVMDYEEVIETIPVDGVLIEPEPVYDEGLNLHKGDDDYDPTANPNIVVVDPDELTEGIGSNGMITEIIENEDGETIVVEYPPTPLGQGDSCIMPPMPNPDTQPVIRVTDMKKNDTTRLEKAEAKAEYANVVVKK